MGTEAPQTSCPQPLTGHPPRHALPLNGLRPTTLSTLVTGLPAPGLAAARGRPCALLASGGAGPGVRQPARRADRCLGRLARPNALGSGVHGRGHALGGGRRLPARDPRCPQTGLRVDVCSSGHPESAARAGALGAAGATPGSHQGGAPRAPARHAKARVADGPHARTATAGLSLLGTCRHRTRSNPPRHPSGCACKTGRRVLPCGQPA